MAKLSINKTTPVHSARWHAALEIYRASFPKWEREPETVLFERVLAGSYVMYCASDQNGNVVGFYILEISQAFNYMTFCFLAVSEPYRGLGWGTELCCDAIYRFHHEYQVDWLLIEAQDEQADFYSKHGFKKVAVPYHAPKFGSSGSVPMHLMIISAKPNDEIIEGCRLAKIIRHIFVTGYYLNTDDARIDQQIEFIPKRTQLLSWPP